MRAMYAVAWCPSRAIHYQASNAEWQLKNSSFLTPIFSVKLQHITSGKDAKRTWGMKNYFRLIYLTQHVIEKLCPILYPQLFRIPSVVSPLHSEYFGEMHLPTVNCFLKPASTAE